MAKVMLHGLLGHIGSRPVQMGWLISMASWGRWTKDIAYEDHLRVAYVNTLKKRWVRDISLEVRRVSYFMLYRKERKQHEK